jgi:hypothetical protein
VIPAFLYPPHRKDEVDTIFPLDDMTAEENQALRPWIEFMNGVQALTLSRAGPLD